MAPTYQAFRRDEGWWNGSSSKSTCPASRRPYATNAPMPPKEKKNRIQINSKKHNIKKKKKKR
jgi:hypothetical protein